MSCCCRYMLVKGVVAAFLRFRLGDKAKSSAQQLHFFDLEKLQTQHAAVLACWLRTMAMFVWSSRKYEVHACFQKLMLSNTKLAVLWIVFIYRYSLQVINMNMDS